MAGFWQLDRAEQKRFLLTEQQNTWSTPAQMLTGIDAEKRKNYLRVFVEGEWSEVVFLLDNRVRSGRVGYEVLRLLDVNGHLPVLVNLGWIEAPVEREILPAIERLFGRHRIEGYLYRAEKTALVLAEQQWQKQWPERIQAIDFELIEERIDQELYPHLLRIDPGSPLAHRADWSIDRSDPQMHLGYAFQWFLMSMTLIVMTLFASSNLAVWLKVRWSKTDKKDESGNSN